jgi:Ribonuclease G/E
MRSAILTVPRQRTAGEHRRVLRTAIRQLERADLYLAAVASMDLGDAAVRRSLDQIRRDVEGLNRYLRSGRSRLTE